MANGRANTSSFQGYASPNYTPVPDELFDEQLAELSGSELKVLLYVCRRTFGFKRDADNISLSQMLTGLRTRDGRVLDRGTGLSKKTLLGAIKSLEEKNIIITTRRRSVEKGDEPTAYRLNVRHTGLEHATAASREKAAPPVGEKVHQGGGGEIPPAPWGNFSPTQETDRKTEENLSSIRKVSPNVDKFDEPPASEAQHPASRHPNIEDVGTILERHNVVRHVPQQDEDYQVIQAYIVDFAREFNDQASLKISTTRAYNLFKRAGVSREVMIEQLYAARAIVKERTGTIRSRGSADAYGIPTKNKAAYFYAVLEDLLGLRGDAPSSPPAERGR